MSRISLNKRELNRIVELYNSIMDQSKDVGSVELLTEDGNNGIGNVLKASFFIEHKGAVGNFIVTITDEGDW